MINVDHGYTHRIDQFHFVNGIFDVARCAVRYGFRLVVVTNQAGIARGYYSKEQFHQLTSWMCEQFMKQGATIEKVYFSPFHPTEGQGQYKRDDFSRKPHPGMILRAQQELGLDLSASILIGDKATDIQAGLAAGVGLNVLCSMEAFAELDSCSYRRIHDLQEALSIFETPDAAKLMGLTLSCCTGVNGEVKAGLTGLMEVNGVRHDLG